MRPRAQVDDADVALAHAENVARDDLVELELVELGLGDRLHANRAARDEPRERIVALLYLARVVRFDRAEVEDVPFERVGGVRK